MKKLCLGVVCAAALLINTGVSAKTDLKDISEFPAVNVMPAKSGQNFNKNHWAYKRLEVISKKYGLLIGNADDVFNSSKPLTREEAALILVNLVGKIERDQIQLSEMEKDQLDILKQELSGEIQKLATRVDALETDVKELQGSVSKIEGATDKTWLHPYGKDFKLSGELTVMYNANINRGYGTPSPNFDLDAMALYVGGRLHDHVEYVAGLNFNTLVSGTGSTDKNGVYSEPRNKVIDDAYIRTDIIPHHYLHIGQVRVPIGQEGSMSSIASDNIKKAQIGRNFSDKRDIGVKAIGRWSWIDYYLGVFNGTGQNNIDDTRGEMDVATWFMLKPFHKHPEWGTLELGYGYDFATDENNVDHDTWGTYAGYKYKRFKLSGEYAKKNGYGSMHDAKAYGYYIRAAYDLTKKHQLIATYDVFDPNTGVGNNNIYEYTLGGRYRLLDNIILKYNWVHIVNKATKGSDRFTVLSQYCF